MTVIPDLTMFLCERVQLRCLIGNGIKAPKRLNFQGVKRVQLLLSLKDKDFTRYVSEWTLNQQDMPIDQFSV